MHSTHCISNIIVVHVLYKFTYIHTFFKYTVNPDSQDEVKDYINARYLSASEAAWRIFGFQINHREPSVSPLPIHLPGCDQVVFEEQTALQSTVSMLDRYLSRPEDVTFDHIKYCEYYEQYMVCNTIPRTATTV